MKKEIIEKILIKSGVSTQNAKDFSPILSDSFEKHNFEDEAIFRLLSNSFVETGLLSKLKENLNYSKAERLIEIFGSKLFPSIAFANQYVMKPVKLADYIYDSRIRKNTMGNNKDGDGSKYIGRGLLQTTWYANYKKLQELTGLDVVNNPDLLLDKKNAVESAVIFFMQSGLNSKESLSKEINNAEDFKAVRRKINGGTVDYKLAYSYYEKLKNEYKKLV